MQTLTLAGNPAVVPLRDVPVSDAEEFREAVVGAIHGGGRLASFFACPPQGRSALLVAAVADDAARCWHLVATNAEAEFPSIAAVCPEAHLFEREIAEQSGLLPRGHPWLKPVRCPPRPGRGAAGGDPTTASETPPGGGSFFAVEGEGVHEVAVGPVHAGIIEPGHFRFQCRGERVLHLEIALGYQHRGVERAAVGGPTPRSVHYMETLAGDTTIGHTWAYCQIVEALSGLRVPRSAYDIRLLALELERLANHTGDLGALANDVGFLPVSAFCGRLRGDFLNMTALLCGNRFGRGLLRPGGVTLPLEAERLDDLRRRLDATVRDVSGAASLLFSAPSVLARFEETGTVTRETAAALGLVGPAARASGLARDVRADHPFAPYGDLDCRPCVCTSGDVFARARVRVLEIERSAAWAKSVTPADGDCRDTRAPSALPPDTLCIAAVEGWRGEILHVALTDADGRFRLYKVTDPSFHNWFGLAMAMRNQEISDFPLCNKSFNLSYCGFDL